MTQYLVLWLGDASPADTWRRAEELDHCSDLVAEYDTIAPTRRAARNAARRAAAARHRHRARQHLWWQLR